MTRLRAWLLLVEAFGGVASGGARLLRFLSRRATDKKRGRDGTKYSKFHPSNYLAHHLASISLAAVYTDAVHIEEGIDGLKQRALALAPCDSEWAPDGARSLPTDSDTPAPPPV